MGQTKPAYFNEMFEGDRVRPPYAGIDDWAANMPMELRSLKQSEAEALFRRIGITFAVYGDGGDPDRLIPFDMFPRVFAFDEWRKLERGIKQRARALNAFLMDVYGRGEIIRAGRVPEKLVYQNEAFEPAVMGVKPRHAVQRRMSSPSISNTRTIPSTACSGSRGSKCLIPRSSLRHSS